MNKFPFADFNQINNEMNDLGLKSHEKLAYMHSAIGGGFHDKENDYDRFNGSYRDAG